jgi:hypothetical protein
VKLYIAGPMTGLPDYNLDAFAIAATRLRACGYDARNPGSRGVIEGYTWRDYIRDGLSLLLFCEAVAVLDGWEQSKGATLEVHVARSLALPVEPVDHWLASAPRTTRTP